jgi:hypothetical protein
MSETTRPMTQEDLDHFRGFEEKFRKLISDYKAELATSIEAGKVYICAVVPSLDGSYSAEANITEGVYFLEFLTGSAPKS